MQELEQILKDHAARYPRMEAVDYLKLLYQNEFGSGHLVRDRAQAEQAIQQEQEALIAYPPAPAPELEPIGNGQCRLPLALLPEDGAPALARLLAASAEQVRGSEAAFREKLALLFALCEGGALPIPRAAMEEEARRRIAGGPVPVSHSAAYRDAYHPHTGCCCAAMRMFCPPSSRQSGSPGRAGCSRSTGGAPAARAPLRR